MGRRNPLAFLRGKRNWSIAVILKDGTEYRGMLENSDPYMNLVLRYAKEYRDEKMSGNYEQVFIRGDCILYIKLQF